MKDLFFNKYKIIAIIVVVIIIIVVAIVIYKKNIKKDYKQLILSLPFVDKDFYFIYYKKYAENKNAYTLAEKQRFLKNYNYDNKVFEAVLKDAKEYDDEKLNTFLAVVNPIQGFKNIANYIKTSNYFPKIKGQNLIAYLPYIKSKIMFSMMANRYYSETNRVFIEDIFLYYDDETLKELYNYLKKLPESV
jgi:hypothetical protein